MLDVLDPALRRDAVTADVRPKPGQDLHEIARHLLDSHPGSHVIVGHSLGGMLALEAELLDRSRVLGLVLVSAIPGRTQVSQRTTKLSRPTSRSVESETVADEFADRLFSPGRPSRSPDIKADFVGAMAESGASSVCAALRAIARWDASDRLTRLNCPTEVVTGDAEPDIDRQRKLAALLGAPFNVLEQDWASRSPRSAGTRGARDRAYDLSNAVRDLKIRHSQHAVPR